MNFFNGTTLIGTATLIQGINFTSTATLNTASLPGSLSAVFAENDANFNGSSSRPSTALSGGAPVAVSVGSSIAEPVGLRRGLPARRDGASRDSREPHSDGHAPFSSTARRIWDGPLTLDAGGSGTLPIPMPRAAVRPPAPPACPAAAPMLVLSPGTHAITATYSGDANYDTGVTSSPLTLTIAQAPSATRISGACAVTGVPSQCIAGATVADAQPPAGGPVHFMTMGTVGPGGWRIPSGTVQFFSGSTSIGTAPLTSSTTLSQRPPPQA